MFAAASFTKATARPNTTASLNTGWAAALRTPAQPQAAGASPGFGRQHGLVKFPNHGDSGYGCGQFHGFFGRHSYFASSFAVISPSTYGVYRAISFASCATIAGCSPARLVLSLGSACGRGNQKPAGSQRRNQRSFRQQMVLC